MRVNLTILFCLFAYAGYVNAADHIVQEVRHEVLLVPGYTVFDWIEYQVEGGKVRLLGDVTRADVKRDVENAVKHIKGVTTVQNDIEVLPASATDDRIRQDLIQAIDKSMSVYMSEEIRRIHVIVKNGNVTLNGEVSSQSDKDHAFALAKHEQNVREVTNNLAVQK